MKKLFALVPLAVMLCGCPSGTQQQKVAQAAENLSSVVKAAQQAEETAYAEGQACGSQPNCIVIPPADHEFIQKEFGAIGLAGKALDSCILSATTPVGDVQCAQTATNTITALGNDGALGLKSDKAKTIFAGVITALNVGIQAISTILGGN